MKIVITGAGGGHFYPLIAVATRIRKESFIQKIAQPDLYFFSDKAYDEEALVSVDCKFVQIPAGKLRLYPSLETITDVFKTVYGCFFAVFKLYSLYPDVVFAKGGYASFPTLLAARILSIPVVVHESDTVPGRTTKWAGSFAYRVALSYQEAASSYQKEKIALTGQPIRDQLLPPEDFNRVYTQKDRPVILVLGGSQGSQIINNTLIKILPELLKKYDVVHQTGKENLVAVKEIVEASLHSHPYKDRYFADGFIDMQIFYGKVDLVITRAGSSMFEMALWQLPMIVIPIPESISRDQRTNAYVMSSHKVASVLEEDNLGSNTLMVIIDRIFDSKENYEAMISKTGYFENSRTAATTIAREIIRIGLSHT